MALNELESIFEMLGPFERNKLAEVGLGPDNPRAVAEMIVNYD